MAGADVVGVETGMEDMVGEDDRNKKVKRTGISLHTESGQRRTAQRELLLALLRKADGHMDAAELYEHAHQTDTRLSLSTVYRNLSLFKSLA